MCEQCTNDAPDDGLPECPETHQRTGEPQVIAVESGEAQPCDHDEGDVCLACATNPAVREALESRVRIRALEAENHRLRTELAAVHDSAEKLARRCIQAARGSR